MKKRYGKKLIQGCMIVLIFLVFCISFWVLTHLLRPIFINIIINNGGDEVLIEEIEKIFSYAVGLADMCLSLLVTALANSKIDSWLNTPQILITPRRTQQQNVSGIKKDTHISYKPKIEIGIKQEEYRIVYAKVINVGKTLISSCSIEGETVAFLLDTNQNTDLYLILYDSTNSLQDLNKIYSLTYSIQDVKNRIYTGIYQMRIERGIASFHISKKTKRRRSK